MIVTYENLKKAVPVLQEIEKAFLLNPLETNIDPLMSGQTEIFMNLGLENPKLMAQGFTEYRNIMARFQTDMGNIVSRFQSGTMSYSEAVKSWRTLTKDRYIDMFKAGTKAVGNPYYTDADIGLTRKDLSFINKARRAEAKFFQRFLRDIKDPLHGAPKGTLGRRIKAHDYMNRGGYYAKSAKAQMFNGMVAGAGQNLIIHWKLGTPQGDHCDVCPIYANRQWTWKTLPTVPRAGDTPCLFNCYCFVDGRTGIMTDEGVKRISKIKVGDRVLTHLGKFEEVINYWVESCTEDVLEIEVQVLNRKRKYKVTKEHKFMLDNGTWIKAKDIVLNTRLKTIVQQCPQCQEIFISNNHMPYECCSKKCSEKFNGKQKIKKAHEVVAKRIKSKKWNHLGNAMRGKTYDEMYDAETTKRLKRNRSATGKKVSQMFFANRSLAKMTDIEKIVSDILYKLNIKFIYQHPIDDIFHVDFFLPEYNIVIECDGNYWHNYPHGLKGDIQRDKYLRHKKKYLVLRFWGNDIKKQTKKVENKLLLTCMNHNGRFIEHYGMVTGIKVLLPGKHQRKKYDLTVENAHSYVTWEGVVSHNCHLEFTTRQGKRLGGDPDTGKSVFQPGGAPGVGAPQRSGQIRDAETGEVMDSKLPPDMAQEHEALRKSLNRYRQMIEVTEGDMLKIAIQARKQLNAKLIALQKQYPGLRFSPTMSVKDLVATVNIAKAKGGTFLLSIQDIQLGDEILLIRGTTSRAGKVVMDASGELVVEFADGTIIPLDAESDLVFRMRSNENTKVGGFTAESFKKFASIAEAEAYALKHFADRVDFKGGTLEQVNGFMRALHESKANFKWANDKLTEVAIVTGKNYRSGLINILPRKYISNACFVPKGKGCIYLGKNVHKDFSNKLLLDNLKTLEINQKFYEGKIASYKELVKKFESKFGANIQNITQVRKAGADYREWTEYKSNINQIKIYQDELDKVPYQRKEIQFKLDNRIDDNVLVKDHTCWNFADDIETQARVIVNHEMGHAMHSWYQTEVNQFWGKMGTKYGMANKYTLMDELSPTLRYQAEKITQPTKMISEIMAETFNFFKEGKWNYMKKDWVDFWQSMMTDATAIENTMKTF